jgi:hypothetical protein
MTWLVRMIRSLGVTGAVANARTAVEDYRRGIQLADELGNRLTPALPPVERIA